MSRAAEPGSAARFPLRYLLVLWLLVLSAVGFLDRTNISIAGVQISREFHLDNTHLGWVFSAFLIGYAAFQIPGGVAARRLGPRRSLFFGVLWWGLFTSLTALVPSNVTKALLILVLVRFALGAGEAVLYPSINQFVERWVPTEERGKANGVIFAGVGLGAGATPPLVTALILRYGWRAPFWMSAAVGIIAGTIWYLAARDSPEEHPWITAPELALIRAGRNRTGMSDDRPHNSGQRVPWRTLLVSKETLVLTASYFAFCYATWIFFGWFYIYLVQVRRLSLKTSAIDAMFAFISMTVGSVLGGLAGDWLVLHYSRRWGRCWLTVFSMALAATLLVLGSRAHNAQLATCILAGSVGTLYLSQNCFWALTADMAGAHAGVLSGMMNMGGQIGGAVAASLTPLIAAHFGWNASFAVAALLTLLGALSWIAIDPDHKLEMERPVEKYHG
jgi:ACS family glucarate transporter-like MFS transporter